LIHPKCRKHFNLFFFNAILTEIVLPLQSRSTA